LCLQLGHFSLKNKIQLDAGAYVCNPSNSGGTGGKIKVQGQPGQKVSETSDQESGTGGTGL
jgi:hypothetical protein